MQIETRKGMIVIDDQDEDLLCFKWHIDNRGYVVRSHPRNRKIRMHRVILERKIGIEMTSKELCDHINRDRSDNRRDNLRVVDHKINALNRKSIGRYSDKKGVTYDKNNHKYQAQIRIERRTVYLGQFDNEEDAHEAHKSAAIKYRGVFYD